MNKVKIYCKCGAEMSIQSDDQKFLKRLSKQFHAEHEECHKPSYTWIQPSYPNYYWPNYPQPWWGTEVPTWTTTVSALTLSAGSDITSDGSIISENSAGSTTTLILAPFGQDQSSFGEC